MRIIKEWWKQYKYRFLPWIIFNLKDRSVRSVPQGGSDKLVSDHHIVDSLHTFFTACHHNVSTAPHRPLSELEELNQKSCEKILGFRIERGPSRIEDGGTGVVVMSGHVRRGSVVAMYPGLIYQVYDPIFLQSVGNAFLFRCIDGVLVDGRDRGLSRFLYKSCANRDRCGAHMVCDTTWLGDHPVNPLAVGQYVNNHNKEWPANVSYQECDIPHDFPLELRRFLPNAFFTSSAQHTGAARLCRTVVLVSTRDIEAGEELLSSYFTVVH